eukprot:TRINITY_DN9210_c0_g1_i1.p1 TRINITY_DN9210_c0_g1~~TRINITY_DN9210_c0_g1_i1.p1  ORF type:complete len:843 (+),score=159.09 TRINITY_DN9210_c0_g1_i1:49-2577(+)
MRSQLDVFRRIHRAHKTEDKDELWQVVLTPQDPSAHIGYPHASQIHLPSSAVHLRPYQPPTPTDDQVPFHIEQDLPTDLTEASILQSSFQAQDCPKRVDQFLPALLHIIRFESLSPAFAERSLILGQVLEILHQLKSVDLYPLLYHNHTPISQDGKTFRQTWAMASEIVGHPSIRKMTCSPQIEWRPSLALHYLLQLSQSLGRVVEQSPFHLSHWPLLLRADALIWEGRIRLFGIGSWSEDDIMPPWKAYLTDRQVENKEDYESLENVDWMAYSHGSPQQQHFYFCGILFRRICSAVKKSLNSFPDKSDTLHPALDLLLEKFIRQESSMAIETWSSFQDIYATMNDLRVQMSPRIIPSPQSRPGEIIDYQSLFSPDEPRQHMLFCQATVHIHFREYAEAEKLIEKSLEVDPDFVVAILTLRLIYRSCPSLIKTPRDMDAYEEVTNRSSSKTPEQKAESRIFLRRLMDAGFLTNSSMGSLWVFLYGYYIDILDTNAANALWCYEFSSLHSDTYAQNNLGYCYYIGQGTARNCILAADYYLRSALNGNPNAQNNIGLCFEKGDGVGQDYDEALKWFRLAADQNYSNALNNMGLCYYNGQGVEQDYLKAIDYYKLAADQGNPNGQINLGLSYFHADGVDYDPHVAVSYFRKAALQDSSSGLFNLGICYYHGEGVEQSFEQAIHWFQRASDLGNGEAKNNLGLCYYHGHGVEENHAEAAKWYKDAVEHDNLDAYSNLGILYLNGEGIESDTYEASRLFHIAANRGSEMAQHCLGASYQNNFLGIESFREARKWYALACKTPTAEGMETMLEIMRSGKGHHSFIWDEVEYILEQSGEVDVSDFLQDY